MNNNLIIQINEQELRFLHQKIGEIPRKLSDDIHAFLVEKERSARQELARQQEAEVKRLAKEQAKKATDEAAKTPPPKMTIENPPDKTPDKPS